MKDLKEAIRVKEEQIRMLMEQIDKLRAAVSILEEEQNPLGVVVDMDPHGQAKHPEAPTVPVQKRAWP